MDLLRTIISPEAISHNISRIRQVVGDTQVMAVVKADAYNHGVDIAVPAMLRAGVTQFGVTTLVEAHRVKDLAPQAQVLSWIWQPSQPFRQALERGITLTVSTAGQLTALLQADIEAQIYLKVDTGMHRNGFGMPDMPAVFQAMSGAKHLTLLGLMSHFACADDIHHPEKTDDQMAEFRSLIDVGRDLGFQLPVNHIANSPATLSRPDVHCDMVRPGVACYGLEPIPGSDHGLRPAMTWESTVLSVNSVRRGRSVSYGHTWTAPHDCQVAVVAGGYADGLSRSWQEKFRVGINGQLYPQVGRVCMDQCMVNLGDNRGGVAVGDRVTLFGSGGMSATEFATAVDTINYEVVCSPHGRTMRVQEG